MDKLEKHIKDKLKEREIAPTGKAWNKIAMELNEENSNRKKRSVWWSIAAGVTTFLLLSIPFFNSKEPLPQTDKIVVVDENTPEASGEDQVLDKDGENKGFALPQGEIVFEKTNEQEPLTKDIVLVENTDKPQEPDNEMSPSLKDVQGTTELAISTKIEEVLKQINALESQSIAVSDAEIDSLLMAAQRELLANSALEKNGKVDAMALLDEVELELYDDRRNPLFIKLKEGFFKLRTAVADRNN